MRQVEKHLYVRGKNTMFYARISVPKPLRAQLKKNEFTRCLHTGDIAQARRLLRIELVQADALIEQARKELAAKTAKAAVRRVSHINDAQMAALGEHWVHQVLLSDEVCRQHGLNDDEFDELSDTLTQQRRELGRLLAQGRHEKVTPALLGFLHLCGIDATLGEQELGRLSYAFLQSVVSALDARIQRQNGEVVSSAAHAPSPPLTETVEQLTPRPPEVKLSWQEVFDIWNQHVPGGRPKPTRIAMNTTWRDLERFAAGHGAMHPVDVTPELVSQFVDHMAERLEVDTLNDRLAKVKHVYRLAVGKLKLPSNPAEKIVGRKAGNVKKRQKKKLHFDTTDIDKIFSSPLFTQHLRSQGQAKEASYWIPLLMYYTGARPEEVAGLALADIIEDSVLGWYIDIIDRPEQGEKPLVDVVEDGEEPHSRTLKNKPSIRRVPVAKQLIDLGFFRYVEWVRNQGKASLFPDLRKDSHDKLSGAFCKFFGRYKKTLGYRDKLKTLYSFRHTMKNLMEQALIPSKYLKRIMGHTSGDGDVTDGYGGDLPLDHIFTYFGAIKFRELNALPWEPGRGHIRLRDMEEDDTEDEA